MRPMARLREFFFGNWRNKGVALFFAVLIWYVAYQSEKKGYSPLVRVEIVSTDPNYVVKEVVVDTRQAGTRSSGVYDGHVLFEFSGPRKEIERLKANPIPPAMIAVPPQRASYSFRQEDFGFPREGVEIVRFEPASVIVFQEEKTSVVVQNPSEKIVVSNYPPGYEVTQREVVPGDLEIRLTGPKSMVSRADVTIAVSMGFLRERYEGPADVTLNLPPDVPESLGRKLIRVEPSQVRVVVAVRAGMEVWAVDAVRVTFRVPPLSVPTRIVLDDVPGDAIPVEFHGRKEDIARLREAFRQQPSFSVCVPVPSFDREEGGQFTFTEDSLELNGFPGIQIRQHESRRKEKKTAWSYKVIPQKQ